MTVRSAEAEGSGPATAEVVLTGELDIATVDDAQRQIEAAEATSPALLIIDLSHLEFVDSSGVRLALLAEDRARSAGRRVAVRLGTGHALRVFQALGLVDKVDVVPATTDDAAAG
jgi:anti-sigma B factor antagonist